MIRLLGFIVFAAGLLLALGRDYLDLGLPPERLEPIGLIAIVVGGVMFLLGGRRRQRRARREVARQASKTSSIGYRQPESAPEPEKRRPDVTWGREGDRD